MPKCVLHLLWALYYIYIVAEVTMNVAEYASSWQSAVGAAMPSGYPRPTRYPVFISIPDPTQFRNHRVAGYPKHQVLPDISGKPKVSGTTRYFAYHT